MANFTSPQSDSNLLKTGLSEYKIESYPLEKGRLDSTISETYKREKLRDIFQNAMKYQ